MLNHQPEATKWSGRNFLKAIERQREFNYNVNESLTSRGATSLFLPSDLFKKNKNVKMPTGRGGYLLNHYAYSILERHAGNNKFSGENNSVCTPHASHS